MAKKSGPAKRSKTGRKRRHAVVTLTGVAAKGEVGTIGTATGVGAATAAATGNAVGAGAAAGAGAAIVAATGNTARTAIQTVTSRHEPNAALQSTQGVVEPPPAAVSAPQGGDAHLGGASSLTADAIVIPAPIKQVIGGRLSKQSVDIRDAARAFAHALKQEAENLRSNRPNDRSERELAKYDDLVSFLEKIAAGLTDLAGALDEAIKETTDGSVEPARLTAAAQITHNLQQAVMQWIEKNAGSRISSVLDVALFTGSVLFLHSLGADSVAAIGALGLIIRGAGKRKDPPKKKGEPPKKKRR
jgi:hypothetical protein